MESRDNSSNNVQMGLSMVAEVPGRSQKDRARFKVKFVLLCLRSVSAVTFGIKTGRKCWSDAKDKVYLMSGG